MFPLPTENFPEENIPRMIVPEKYPAVAESFIRETCQNIKQKDITCTGVSLRDSDQTGANAALGRRMQEKQIMRNRIFAGTAGVVLLLLTGCCCVNCKAVREAQTLIRTGKAECVLIRQGRILYAERGRGVSPLLRIYDTHRTDMAGSTVVDKVIGRAAAAVAICGKAKHVHGQVVSQDAVDFLRQYRISCSYDLLVPRILNRRRDGLCPLEKAVENCREPESAVNALRKTIAAMRK